MSATGTLSVTARQAAWKNFTRSGDPHYLTGLPERVAESWQRSWRQEVKPTLRCTPLDPTWQLSADTQARQLLRDGLPFLAAMREDLSATPSVLLLVSASGRIIHREGSVEVLRKMDAYNSIPGACVAEDLVGTNAYGTVLLLKEPLVVDLYEHFCEEWLEWADVGVPLVHPVSQECLGALGLSFLHKSPTPEAMMLAKTIACSIQAGLFAYEREFHLLLLERFVQRTQRQGAAVLAVDRNGIILAGTPAFAQWLQVAPERLPGHSLSFFPQLDQALRDAIARGKPSDIVLAVPYTDRVGTVAIEPLQRHEETAGALLFLSLPQSPVRSLVRKGPETRPWSARYTFADLLGEDPHSQATLRLARRIAPTEIPVLIQGETGTGKELLAHAIHAASPRRQGPFVAVNCGAIPQELIASELFGYEKGAFTGASSAGKRGKMELAHGGTIFLDEITEASPTLQVSLLRALQDQEILPVGSERARKIDVRVIAATNQDVTDLLHQGVFRPDLYYRLNGVSLTLPPLRERREDLPLLARHFLQEAGTDKTLSPEALAILQQYAWPGNIRELRTVLHAATVLADGPVIEVCDLPRELQPAPHQIEPTTTLPPTTFSLAVGLKQLELQALMDAIQLTYGNLKRAARELGIGRSSLYRKLHEFGITVR